MKTNSTPHFKVVEHAYSQAETLGIEYCFPCNPTIEDLCSRAAMVDMAPVITFIPYEQANAINEGEAELKYAPKQNQ